MFFGSLAIAIFIGGIIWALISAKSEEKARRKQWREQKEKRRKVQAQGEKQTNIKSFAIPKDAFGIYREQSIKNIQGASKIDTNTYAISTPPKPHSLLKEYITIVNDSNEITDVIGFNRNIDYSELLLQLKLLCNQLIAKYGAPTSMGMLPKGNENIVFEGEKAYDIYASWKYRNAKNAEVAVTELRWITIPLWAQDEFQKKNKSIRPSDKIMDLAMGNNWEKLTSNERDEFIAYNAFIQRAKKDSRYSRFNISLYRLPCKHNKLNLSTKKLLDLENDQKELSVIKTYFAGNMDDYLSL